MFAATPFFRRVKDLGLKGYRLTGKQLKCFLILFHLLAVAYAVVFLHPYYGSNDEFTLASIASGAYGSMSWYFIYLHSGLGWLIKLFYLLIPSLNWYTIIMYAMIFLSLTAIGFVWIERSERTGTILAVLLIMASLQPLYVEMQYTKTAAAVTAAGYVLLLGQRNEKGKVLRYVPGILLLLLGSWIRFESFGMVSLLAFGLWLVKVKDVWKEKDWKRFLMRDCLPCVFAFALVFGSIAAENLLVYTPGSPQEHYRRYDEARQALLDYGVPEWDEYQEEYEALGLTRTDYLNLENWLIADSDRYTADVYESIIAFRQDRPFQWEYLADYLVNLATKPLFVLSALMAVFWFLFSMGRGRQRNWIGMCWPFVALLGIYLYFIKIYRVLPIVVTACLLAVLAFVWTSALPELSLRWEERLSGRRFLAGGLAGAVLTGGICVHMLVSPVFLPAVQDSEASMAFRELYDTITADKKVYYVFDPLTSNGMELGYSIFEKIPDNYLTNVFTLGGWETESPQVAENLWAYDESNLMTSLYTSDRSVLISNTLLEHLMLHLDSTYEGLFLTYSKVNQIGNFDLYTLNYRMSNLKEDYTYTASLDRTYTAENERYDVIEATVDMTPEELEGKSVFLWMESVESGKQRMYQGTWQQQDENGLYSLLYDTDLEDTDQVRFMIPKMSFRLDDRYIVHVVIRDTDRGTKIATENNLYQ